MKLEKRDYDAVVVGSGPNGLAAAILMQQKGLSVLIIEGKNEIGGGLRTEEFTLPGFKHDVCSAIHPLAVASPFFQQLPLDKHGLQYVYSEYPAAHPFDNGTAVVLTKSVKETATRLGVDEHAYLRLMWPIVKNWPSIAPDVLGPLRFPNYPFKMAAFGLSALAPAASLARRFETPEARALFAGMAAHAMQPLSKMTTSAAGLVLMANGHLKGWPMVKGGSVNLAKALASYFTSIGGTIETGEYVTSLEGLPSAHAYLFDVSPKQLLQIAGHSFSYLYEWQLSHYRYGMGVFKVDWALGAPIPFKAEDCKKAATVHIGNTIQEIALGEKQIWNGRHPKKPFVLLAQQSNFDPTRAPKGKQTAWAYCHVPNGSKVDMTDAIENQIERFAPGFKERILAKHTMNTEQVEEYNPNYIGGDINGGVIDIGQLFTRPALRFSPYKTSAKGIYICSASTPPGGGVHGMCGYNAAKRALKDVFGL